MSLKFHLYFILLRNKICGKIIENYFSELCLICVSGLAIVESRVGEKMAEKLVSELGLLFDPSKDFGGRRRTFASLEDLFKPRPARGDVIEEIILQNGQKQSR